MTIPRKPGWYHTLTVQFAWDNYGFPPNPEKGWEFIAEDGSQWEFDVHGQDHWDLMNYSGECSCPECSVATDEDYCTECLGLGHHLGVSLV